MAWRGTAQELLRSHFEQVSLQQNREQGCKRRALRGQGAEAKRVLQRRCSVFGDSR